MLQVNKLYSVKEMSLLLSKPDPFWDLMKHNFQANWARKELQWNIDIVDLSVSDKLSTI